RVPFCCRPPTRPPRSTLLPYTTLFRSTACMYVLLRQGEDEGRRSPPITGSSRSKMVARSGSVKLAIAGLGAIGLPVARRVDAGEDRKSTRLNSSHLGISYAVFCLKKKK